MSSNHLLLCHPLLLPPSIFPSTRFFSNESALRIRWPKYWSFSFSISPSNEYSGFISSRIDWFDLLSVQETLKSLASGIPWTEEPGGLQSMGVAESDTTEQLHFHFSSVIQSCPTLCDPMNCSMSGLPVHHQLPEITETRFH